MADHSALESISLADLVKGDKATWDAFVPPAAAVMRALIRRTLRTSGREEETSDVLQEAFIRICQNDFHALKRYDPKRAKLSTWIGLIAIGAALDHVRRKKLETVDLEQAPEEAFATNDKMPEASKLTIPENLLSPRQALILKLIYEDDWEVSEVASHLQIEEQTVRSMRHKALEKLRKYMKQEA